MDEKTLIALNHFGELDNAAEISITIDENDMSHSSGRIIIGCHTIKPKNSATPKRIVIDTDPAFPYILLRVIDWKC